MTVVDLINILLKLDQNKIQIVSEMSYREKIAVLEYPKEYMSFPN